MRLVISLLVRPQRYFEIFRFSWELEREEGVQRQAASYRDLSFVCEMIFFVFSGPYTEVPGFLAGKSEAEQVRTGGNLFFSPIFTTISVLPPLSFSFPIFSPLLFVSSSLSSLFSLFCISLSSHPLVIPLTWTHTPPHYKPQKRLRAVDCIISVSEAIRQYILEHGNMDSVHLQLPKEVSKENN